LRGGLGVAEAGNFPAGSKAVANWFPPKRRAISMALFDCGTAVGAVLAPPLVALLALNFGWRAAFVCTGGLGFLWLAGWLAVYHAPEVHPWLTKESRVQLLEELGMKAPPKAAAFGAALRRIVGVRQLWGLMITRLTLAPVWWLYVFWLPDYLSRARGFSLKDTATFAWIPFLTVDLGKMAGGAASDALLARGVSPTIARKGIMIASALAMMSGIMVVNAATATGAIVWVSVATFGFGAWSANVLALHADIFPSETMGTAMGTTLMASNLSGAVFTYGVGQFVDRIGYSPVFWVAGILPLVALVPLIFWVGRVERIHES
jgi:ACS family hexuronate transporter-like MFS transporter